MKENYESLYHELEAEQWWFKSRRHAVLSHLKEIGNREHKKVLDIGCSIGMTLNELINMGYRNENLVGIDVSEKAIAGAEGNGLKNVHVMDAQEIELPENEFDIIISSDCLEHLEKDQKALDKWYKLLKKGGKLIVYVPALMSLWSNHDVANLHYRRYTREELTRKLKKAGFKIEKKSYWNFFLFPMVWMVRKLNNMLKKEDKNDTGDNSMPPKVVNKLLVALLTLENKLNMVVSYPIGVSVFAIATKK